MASVCRFYMFFCCSTADSNCIPQSLWLWDEHRETDNREKDVCRVKVVGAVAASRWHLSINSHPTKLRWISVPPSLWTLNLFIFCPKYHYHEHLRKVPADVYIWANDAWLVSRGKMVQVQLLLHHPTEKLLSKTLKAAVVINSPAWSTAAQSVQPAASALRGVVKEGWRGGTSPHMAAVVMHF